ncbi:AAA family ATPase [Ralstonia pseudosolanacearum]|uniref:AAA family ATPase n=1 Tax=Ralstonia pseudosolanacearum TaxID=1310165 RepID=UPI001FF79E0D|nr:AAA family ATPase [Ralstonia pseudosolanacearum]
MHASYEQQFAAAMAGHGLHHGEIVADGKLHRFDGPDEKRGKRSAWYVLHGDGLPAGSFGDWRTGLSQTWCAKSDHTMTAAERQAHRQRIELAKAEAAAERAKVAEEAAVKCGELWNIAANVDGGHAYVERKGIKPAGAKQLRDALLIPLRDAGGELRSLQFIKPNGFKHFKTNGTVAGCYCALGGKPGPDMPLLICEGWATACSLHEATCYPVAAAMNAGNLLAVAQALRAKLPDVPMIVCADDDSETPGNPGLTKAREVAQAIGALLAVPDFGPERPGGATDFNDLAVACGRGAVLASIEAIRNGKADAGSEGAPEPGTTSPVQGVADRPRLLLACAADIAPEAITWLWPGWLPAGKTSILAGSPGTGKTTLALAMAAIVTTGGTWPDGSRMKKPGRVLIWSSEDDPADTLIPRLMAAGADRHRVHFAQDVADENGELQPFDPARDMHLLSERLAEMGGADLLIVDPIVSAVSGDAHRVNDVRRNLQDLVNVAAAHRCAVLGISHFAKGTKGTSPAERVIGSQAFVALARMVLVAGKEEAAERRILARAKSNISPDDGGVSYSIEQVEACTGITASRIVWGELVQGTAREILGDVEQEDDQEERTERDEAADFLRSLLEAGPMSTKAIKADATGAGYAWRTIERAKRDLGVEARKDGMKGGWVWVLPAEVRQEGDESRPSLNSGGLQESWRSSEISRVCGEKKTAIPDEDRHGKGSGGVRPATDESEGDL